MRSPQHIQSEFIILLTTVEEQMTKQAIGIVGLVAIVLGALPGGIVVFAEKAILAAGIPYHFTEYALTAIALFGLGAVCGVGAWATRPGKIAACLGLALGALMTGYVVLVLTAFSVGG